jgi:hypothetical protein
LGNFDQIFGGRLHTAPHGRSWFHYAVGIGLHALLFALIGPAVGAMAAGFALGWIVTTPILIVFAYMTNTGTAAIAGACFAVATSVVAKPWKLYAVAGAIGAVSAAIFGSLGPNPDELGTIFLASFGAIAAAVCARLARRLRLRADNPYLTSSAET